MRFEAYTPEWQDEVAALADRVFGDGYFAERRKIAKVRETCMSLCIGDDGALAGFARGRVLPQGGFAEFFEHQLEDIPEDIATADAAGVIGTILTVAVAPEYQGKGVGTKLLTILHDQLVGQGGDKLIATFRRGAGARNVDGIMEKLGFQFWTRFQTYERDRCDRGDFKCAHRTDRCDCEALFYRKIVY
jgi:ribosomal protein S18 acetylase RimI-like enzyme